LPTPPDLVAGVLGVVLRIDDIDPNADRLTGEEYTIFTVSRVFGDVLMVKWSYTTQEMSTLSIANVNKQHQIQGWATYNNE
jgi:hypothetical protein